MSERRHRGLKVTRGQARYLRDLLEDDLAETALTPTETDQATTLLDRCRAVLVKFEKTEEN